MSPTVGFHTSLKSPSAYWMRDGPHAYEGRETREGGGSDVGWTLASSTPWSDFQTGHLVRYEVGRQFDTGQDRDEDMN